VPLSDAARKVLAAQPEHVTSILTGGDDYEILATVHENRAVELVRRAASAGVAMTEIGIITAGRGVRAADIPEALLSGGGWDHFRAPEGRS
jgi:thiamine-monophosphate kinase